MNTTPTVLEATRATRRQVTARREPRFDRAAFEVSNRRVLAEYEAKLRARRMWAQLEAQVFDVPVGMYGKAGE